MKLQWSETKEPNKQCAYEHVTADSPLGTFVIEWKSWKESPGYDVTHPLEKLCIYGYFSLEEAKENAQKEFDKLIASCADEKPEVVCAGNLDDILIKTSVNLDKLQEDMEADELFFYGELHISSVDDLLEFLNRNKLIFNHLTNIQSEPFYTSEQFDEVVYEFGYVRLVKACSTPGSDWVYTVLLDGEFSSEALDMINYAMINHREWFKLNNQA